MYTPRTPTPEEMRALQTYMGDDEYDEYSLPYIAVFDHYVSAGPGYVGNVMVVVWPLGPEVYDVFTWDKHGNIQREFQYPWPSD